MNIKPFFLLGMIFISSGACSNNSENNYGFDGFFDGLFSANNNFIANSNLPEGAPQKKQLANANNVQGNNLGQQNVFALQNEVALPPANNAEQRTALQSTGEVLKEMKNSQDAGIRLGVARVFLRDVLNLPNNEQLQPLQSITETLQHIIESESPNATDNLFKVLLILQCVQNTFNNPVDTVLFQVSQCVNDEQQFQLLRSLLLDRDANNV